MTSTQKKCRQSRFKTQKKNTPLIPVCKYAKFTPWDNNASSLQTLSDDERQQLYENMKR